MKIRKILSIALASLGFLGLITGSESKAEMLLATTSVFPAVSAVTYSSVYSPVAVGWTSPVLSPSFAPVYAPVAVSYPASPVVPMFLY